MNKNDFRLQFPLWNACLFFLLMIFSYSAIYAIDLWNTEFSGLFREDGTFYIDKVALITCGISFLSLVVFYYFYLLKVRQYNKTNPTRKIKFFTSIHDLLEFVDDDEMMQQVTNQATRKVYIFYSNILPPMLLLLILPLHRYVYIVAICGLIITQNIIYYRHLSKYAEGINTSNAPLVNKKILITTITTISILAFSFFGLFYKLEQVQQQDLQLIRDCLDKDGTVYFHHTIFNSVSCGQE